MRDYKLTDPEFAERFEHFAFDEVVTEEGQQLDGITRHMAVAATLIGCQGDRCIPPGSPPCSGRGADSGNAQRNHLPGSRLSGDRARPSFSRRGK